MFRNRAGSTHEINPPTCILTAIDREFSSLSSSLSTTSFFSVRLQSLRRKEGGEGKKRKISGMTNAFVSTPSWPAVASGGEIHRYSCTVHHSVCSLFSFRSQYLHGGRIYRAKKKKKGKEEWCNNHGPKQKRIFIQIVFCIYILHIYIKLYAYVCVCVCACQVRLLHYAVIHTIDSCFSIWQLKINKQSQIRWKLNTHVSSNLSKKIEGKKSAVSSHDSQQNKRNRTRHSIKSTTLRPSLLQLPADPLFSPAVLLH